MTIEEQFISIYNSASPSQRQRINDILYGASLATKGTESGSFPANPESDSPIPGNRETVESK